MKTLEIHVSAFGKQALIDIVDRPIWNDGKGFRCRIPECSFDEFLRIVLAFQARDTYFRVEVVDVARS